MNKKRKYPRGEPHKAWWREITALNDDGTLDEELTRIRRVEAYATRRGLVGPLRTGSIKKLLRAAKILHAG